MSPKTVRAQGGHTITGQRRAELLELLDTPAPSGFEAPAAEVWCEQALEFTEEVRTDTLGTSYATVNLGAAGPRIGFWGHVDEIGFVVTKVEKSGVLRVLPIGGWDATVLVGQRVQIRTRNGLIDGVITRAPAHQLSDGAAARIAIPKLWLDIGARNREQAQELVRVGDPGVLAAQPVIFEHSGRIMSRSLDNRLGCYVAREAARACEGLNAEVTAVAAVSEENAQFGALTSGASLAPDIAVVIDVTYTSDVPGSHEETVELDKGPVVIFGAGARSAVGKQLLAVAQEAGIPVQVSSAGRFTGTDTEMVVESGAGVLAGLVAIPTRNLHSPGEIASIADVEATVDLLVAWVWSRAAAHT